MKNVNVKTFVQTADKRWDDYKINFFHIVKTVMKFAADNTKYSVPEISIVLTNDSKIKKLNKEYRGIDAPTNVLSFETGDAELLGDIIISFDTALRESENENKSFKNHATHLVVHGVLHLLGYDHLCEKDANEMESLEIKILKNLGIENPYEDNNIAVIQKQAKSLKFFGPGLSKLWMIMLGALSSFGYAPFNLWWMTILCFAGAYLIFENYPSHIAPFKRFKSGFWIGSFFGAGYAVASFWWVLNSIFVVPELAQQFAIWTVPGLLGIAIGGGIIFGLPFGLARLSGVQESGRPIVFAAAWTLILWMREWVFTGFPWNPVANIAMSYPALSNSMALWGAIGLTFILVGFCAALADFIKHKPRKKYRINLLMFVILLIIGIIAGYINIYKSNSGTVDSKTYRIVQPALTQEDKGTHLGMELRSVLYDNLENLVSLSNVPGADGTIPDVIIWPETAYPYVVANDEFPAAREIGRIVIAGATVYRAGKLYNSMIISDALGIIKEIYDKSHLVPFGEYSPMGGMLPSPGNLEKGDGPRVINISHIDDINEQDSLSNKNTVDKFVPAICYEIVFSDSLIPKGDNPDFIINLTNDTWFGKTPGTYQHLDMTRRYAIESGLPIIRSNYSGISAFISADGKVISSLSIGVAGVLDGKVASSHITPYRIIGRNWMMVFVLVFSLLSLAGKRKEQT